MEKSRKSSGEEQEGQWSRAGRAVEKSGKGSGEEQEGQWRRAGRAVEKSRKGSGEEQEEHKLSLFLQLNRTLVCVVHICTYVTK